MATFANDTSAALWLSLIEAVQQWGLQLQVQWQHERQRGGGEEAVVMVDEGHESASAA